MVYGSDLVVPNAILDSHSEVGDGSECGDEGSQNMEQAFLLDLLSVEWFFYYKKGLLVTYDRDTESHCVEGQRGDEHDDKDNPGSHEYTGVVILEVQTDHRVLVPTSPASW